MSASIRSAIRSFHETRREVPRVLAAAINSRALPRIAHVMISEAPEDTGALRDSISILPARPTVRPRGQVRAGAKYAKYVEFGTPLKRPDAFLDRAFDATATPTMTAVINAALRIL